MYLLPPNPGPLGTLEQWIAWRDELLALGKDTPGVDVELAVAELAIRDLRHIEEGAGGLTCTEAAKLLHVSRTHLDKLVSSGQLGVTRRTAGGEMRIPTATVLEYKAARRKRQTQGLAEMVGASKELGLDDKEQANITAEMLQTLQGIFDPANAHLFSAEAAQRAFAHAPIKKR